jgi:hypothetical protein
MGQGGNITLVNGTPYDWRYTDEPSNGMSSWGFPRMVAAGTTATVYVEFSPTIFEAVALDSGVVTYTLGDTGQSFQIQASAGSGFGLRVVLTNIATTGHPKGSTIDLGWAHNGSVNFILSGRQGSFASSNPPTAWMRENLAVLGSRPLRHLCLPGSHDSGMSTYTSGTALTSACNTLTQVSGVLGQLNFGVRYFDIRPVISGGHYYTGHYSQISLLGVSTWQGANGQSMDSIISDVNTFTAANSELVILYLSHDLNTDLGNQSYTSFTQAEWNALLTQLQGLRHLYAAQDPTADLTTLPLSDFIANGPAVVVVVDPGGTGIELGSFAGKGFYTPAGFPVYNQYSNTNVLAQMQRDQLDKLAAQRPDPDAGYFLLSWTLTQNSTQAATCVLGTADSILQLADTANPALYSAPLPACTPQSYPNILYIDGVQTSDIAALAMAVNGKAIG